MTIPAKTGLLQLLDNWDHTVALSNVVVAEVVEADDVADPVYHFCFLDVVGL